MCYKSKNHGLVIGVPKFFVPRENIREKDAVLSGADAAHIARVLRMHEGDRVTLCDGAGKDYVCEIRALSAEQVALSVLEKAPCETEPSVRVTLFMALPKSDKMEYVIQKSVELGVFRIVPFFSSRCIAKISPKDVKKKTERWQKIAHAAAKQSGRGMIPEVCEPIPFSALCARGGEAELSLFCYEAEEEHSLKSVLLEKSFQTACIVVGPEGGFAPSEVKAAKEAGFRIVSLGRRILRCETAPGCAICAIMYHTDNL